MTKATVIFTVEDLNKIKITDRRKYLKTIIAAAFITNRKNVSSELFDKYFIDKGTLLLSSCIMEFPDKSKEPLNLFIDENTGEITYDKINAFLENDLSNTNDYNIVLQHKSGNKTMFFEIEDIKNIYTTIIEDPINYLYYNEICHYIKSKIKNSKNTMKKYYIDIKMDNIKNELDIIGCILFLEKSKNNYMNVVAFNIITSNSDDEMRLKTFLNLLCKNYNILINGKIFVGAELPYKNLSPCYFFIQEEKSGLNAFQYKAFSKPISNQIISENIFEAFIRCEAERIWYTRLFGRIPEQFYINEYISKKIESFCFNDFEKTIASQIWRNFLDCIECREKALKADLDVVFDSIKNADDKKIELLKEHILMQIVSSLKEDKIIANIMAIVIEFADNSSPSFSCMLLFQFLVAFLTEDMTLGIDLHEDVDGGEVKNIIRRIYLSICSFSEGVFQMIENTCLHSDSHCGFLSTKIHPTALLQSSSIPKLIKNAQNVDKLKSKYELNPESADNPFGAEYHLEIRINDISDHGIVTTYLQNHRNIVSTPNKISLKDFFEDPHNLINAIDATEAERKELIIKHYGLRLLNRIIKVNNGDFKVTTVGEKDTEVYSLSKNKKIEKQTYGTEYSILLPLALQSYESFGDETNCSFDKSPLFSTQSNIDSVITVSPRSLNNKLGKEEKVLSIYQDILKSLEATSAEKWCPNLESQIVCIDFKDYNVSEIELAAKALITLIANIHFQKQALGKKHVANFALLFGENCELKIYEFVRIFSVFYTKSGVCDNKNEPNSKPNKDGINEWMYGVQIALCSSDNYIGNQKFDAVNFIIAGSNIESARLTALSYAYYNSNLSLKYISAVRYFTRTQGTLQKSKYSSRDMDNNIPSLVPFDLFLCGSGTNVEKVCIDKTRSWFIQQIKSVIETPIQNAEYGCKNENIHIKIGSKIHISDFYEAELLFHNISTIEKFAFLIASEILNKKSSMKRKIVLIGYESYSESLILKIKDSLVVHPSVESVAYAIYYKEVIENGHAETLTNIDYIENTLEDGAEIISIMPIGTTLSTVHKIKNVLIRKCKKSFSETIKLQWQNCTHFVILEIRDLDCENSSELSDQENKYWKSISGDIITLNDETYQEETQNIKVQYIIQVFTNWQDASKCKYCLLDKPTQYLPMDYINAEILVDVDKTATIPRSIFKLKKNNRSGYDFLCSPLAKTMLNDEQNNKRFEALNGCIIYSHIYFAHNHFQYYFDTQKYYQKIKKNNNTDINPIEWLKNVEKKLRARTDSAFNIIVSPLKQTNSEFLNDVEKYVFNHNIRFLHFTLEDSYREEIRAKFSYITEEYKRIKKMNKNNKVNIFFVDDAITTGRTFQRACSYIRMLVNESEVFDNTQKVFDGVINLLNRNSYDTICNFVSNPEEDFFSYVHIAISAIKASNGFCPSCRTAEQFLLLKKRSAENDMRMEFDRLANKQKKRTVEEYRNWLDEEIETRHGYLSWAKQWIYTYGDQIIDEKEKIDKTKYFIENIYRTLFKNEDEGQTLTFWNSLSLKKLEHIFFHKPVTDITDDLFAFSKKQRHQTKLLQAASADINFEGIELCKEIIKEYAIPQRDYRRAFCSHRINLATEAVFKQMDSGNTREDINVETVRVLLELFNNDCGYHNDISKFNTCSDILVAKNDNDIITNARKIDLLISYIKTSSRPLPARYHNIEQAIFKIITAFCTVMLEEASKIKTSIEGIAIQVIQGDDEQCEKYRIMFINIAKTFIDFNNIGLDANLSPSHQLELFRVMMNRLGIMQSNFVTNSTVLKRIFDNDGILQETRTAHKNLCKSNCDYAVYCEFPEDEWIIFAYRRMLMRLSMLYDNDSINIALDRELLKNNIKEVPLNDEQQH